MVSGLPPPPLHPISSMVSGLPPSPPHPISSMVSGLPSPPPHPISSNDGKDSETENTSQRKLASSRKVLQEEGKEHLSYINFFFILYPANGVNYMYIFI